ncbi:hypothetical protein BDV98DRAFT_572944 [Pterulicium gracile]|uniref:Uncharacterized protein n=1 Tax=Pterulicium gracile TaxID=1884261 RepID=A0A5C3Q943_9AGAR|nr:hypothetical protein BDV98DRAFT_572944 [Pterula gracilis]
MRASGGGVFCVFEVECEGLWGCQGTMAGCVGRRGFVGIGRHGGDFEFYSSGSTRTRRVKGIERERRVLENCEGGQDEGNGYSEGVVVFMSDIRLSSRVRTQKSLFVRAALTKRARVKERESVVDGGMRVLCVSKCWCASLFLMRP